MNNFTTTAKPGLVRLENASENFKYRDSVLTDWQLLVLCLSLSFISVLGIIVNSVILFISKSESSYRGHLEDKRRRALSYYLICNLALSDLLASLLSSPSLIVQQYIHQFHTDIGCCVFRGIQYLFPSLSAQILAVICLERYFTLAYPFDTTVTRKRWPRIMVTIAWFSALFWVSIVSSVYVANYVSIDDMPGTIAMDCVQDMGNRRKRGLYWIGIFFIVIVPLLTIGFTTVRSIFIIVKYRRSPSPMSGLTECKIHATKLALWLVFITAFTSFPFVIYQAVKMSHGDLLDQRTDTIIRFSLAILVYIKRVINPVIYYKNMKSLRQKVKKLLRTSIATNNAVAQCDTTLNNATYNEELTPTVVVIFRQRKILEDNRAPQSPYILEAIEINPVLSQLPSTSIHEQMVILEDQCK